MFRTNHLIYFFVITLIAAALIASLIAQSWIAAALLIAPLIYLWLSRPDGKRCASPHSGDAPRRTGHLPRDTLEELGFSLQQRDQDRQGA